MSLPVLPVDGRQSAAALAIQRGTGRLLRQYGVAPIPEVTLPNGRRADLLAIGRKGEIWIVEIKSSVADFQVDRKWPDYRRHCDRRATRDSRCSRRRLFSRRRSDAASPPA